MSWKGSKGGGAKGPKGVIQTHLKPAFSAAAPAVPFKTTPCKFFALGQCTKGDACTFIHPGAESPAAPAAPNFKTVPCKFWAIGQCAKGEACTFLHEGAELDALDAPAWQAPAPQAPMGTQAIPCKFFAEGRCAKGAACPFQHGPVGRVSLSSIGKGYDHGPPPIKGYGKSYTPPPIKGYGKGPIGASKGGLAKGDVIKGGFNKGGFKGDFKGDFKGKGKDGKGKKGKKGKPPQHLLPRERISEAPITGTVEEWRGKFGWIRPLEPLEHEKAQRHGGRLFCSKDDIGDLEELAVGATVEFQVWEDASGLGAEEVMQY